MKILIDTREQRPLTIPISGAVTAVEMTTLMVGDYAAEFADGSRPPIVFERKGLGDLFGTMTSGYQRFKREMLTASHSGIKLILLVEASLTEVYGGYGHSQLSGQSCVQKVYTLWLRYGLLPVFASDRSEAAAIVCETFEAVGRCWKAGGQPVRTLMGGLQMPLMSDVASD